MNDLAKRLLAHAGDPTKITCRPREPQALGPTVEICRQQQMDFDRSPAKWLGEAQGVEVMLTIGDVEELRLLGARVDNEPEPNVDAARRQRQG